MWAPGLLTAEVNTFGLTVEWQRRSRNKKRIFDLSQRDLPPEGSFFVADSGRGRVNPGVPDEDGNDDPFAAPSSPRNWTIFARNVSTGLALRRWDTDSTKIEYRTSTQIQDGLVTGQGIVFEVRRNDGARFGRSARTTITTTT